MVTGGHVAVLARMTKMLQEMKSIGAAGGLVGVWKLMYSKCSLKASSLLIKFMVPDSIIILYLHY